jgi:hypothetical protein
VNLFLSKLIRIFHLRFAQSCGALVSQPWFGGFKI